MIYFADLHGKLIDTNYLSNTFKVRRYNTVGLVLPVYNRILCRPASARDCNKHFQMAHAAGTS